MTETTIPPSTSGAVRPRVGVSACLIGDQVRFDGGHARDTFVAESLDPFVTWIKVCPEMEAGLGTPREPIRLIGRPGAIRVASTRTRRDVTAELHDVSVRRAAALASQDLDGFVLKKDSPSCGLHRVRVYKDDGTATRDGRGVFASALTSAMPLLPVEEEGRLVDPGIREHFIERVFAHQRLRELGEPQGVHALMRFHTRHKLLLLAHSPAIYKAMGSLVAIARPAHLGELMRQYREAFMTALVSPATRPKHVNVLQHIAGYFKRLVTDQARREIADAITEYQRDLVPLVVPVTLLGHYARVHAVDYLLGQVYLDPHPRALKLRNHA